MDRIPGFFARDKAAAAAAVTPPRLSPAWSGTLQADLKACAALGVYCATALTAVTAQNTAGVQGIHALPAAFVGQQVQSVLLDIGADVVKTGMLPSADIISALGQLLRQHHSGALVVDPVLVATSGDVLASATTLATLKEELLPLADVVTPNLAEAKALLNTSDICHNVAGMREAAAAIHRMGPKHVLVKGGHLPEGADVVDVFYDGKQFVEFSSGRLQTRNSHGTGCTLAACIAAEMAKGNAVVPAVQVAGSTPPANAARQYLEKVLRSSQHLQIGSGPQGPMDHFPAISGWQLPEESARSRFRPSDLLLYAVTDSRMNKKWRRSMADAVRDAIAGGATFLQIREKEKDAGDFLKEAEEAVKLARDAGVPLVINDRLDVALACGADGVHIGQSDLPASKAREILGPHKIIGVSAKTAEHAFRAWQDGADYLGVGGVFPTSTKANNTTIGLDGLRAVCVSSKLPVVAIGGISKENAVDVLTQQPPALSGVAVVSAIFDSPDVAAATRDLREELKSCLPSRPLKASSSLA
eukprot:SM000025S08463  [mRNA]  locus=s25:892280:896919:+ [translate_table: standard]